MSDDSPDDPSSPLEQMLDKWFEDKQAGRELDAERYIELFSQLHAKTQTAGETTAFGAMPQRVGPYELIDELGRGGQGSVWRARDTRLNRQVALKLLTARGSSLHFERFLREAEIASRLDHPAICAVYDTGTEDGVPYIAMRLVQGRSLAAHIQAGKNSGSAALPTLMLSEISELDDLDSGAETEVEPTSQTPTSRTDIDQVVRFIEGAARGLHAAHEVGVVHRDVKPGNIMITESGDPVILDFGLARDDEGDAPTLTQTGDLFGTPAYMSPEQVRRMGHLDRRTDVWALGVSLYECLTLERPFQASTRHDLYQAILNTEPLSPRRFNRSISKDLRVVIATALEKDADRRYQTAQAFADDLRAVRERRPVAARPVGPQVRFARWVQRNPAVAAAVILAFLLLGALLVQTWMKHADSEAANREMGAQLDRYASLEDGAAARDLVATFDALGHWPAYPDRIPAIDLWIERSEAVLRSLPDHEAELGRIEAAVLRGEDVGVRHELWSTMVQHLRTLSGLVQPMRERREVASGIEHRSLTEHDALWRKTVAAIADAKSHPEYRGLLIKPQLGLVPLGVDLRTGHFEFAHLLSGDPANRNDEGRLVVTEATGVVLVLIPAATAAASNDNDAFADLAPYFISKYEMTQAQWKRFTGSNPSVRAAGQEEIGWTHPVEYVYRDEALNVLLRLGLDLPTELQWSHAARAGTNGRYWCGDGQKEAAAIANLMDASHQRKMYAKTPTRRFAVDDGFPFHAPVDHARCPSNPWGIHGVIGNVSEWCKDPYHNPVEHGRTRLRSGDGMREGGDPKRFVYRGGHFGASATFATHQHRRFGADFRHAGTGVRPVRKVE